MEITWAGGKTEKKSVSDSATPSFSIGCYGLGTVGLVGFEARISAYNSSGTSAWVTTGYHRHNGDKLTKLCS